MPNIPTGWPRPIFEISNGFDSDTKHFWSIIGKANMILALEHLFTFLSAVCLQFFKLATLYLSTWIQKRKPFINALKYLNIFSFLFLVITMCLIQCSHQQQQCPFADQSYREASTWSRFRSTATFIPTSESLAVDTLLMQTSEMHEIINHFKSQFVSLLSNII